jgi:superfamily II DNA or RNA helicase
LISFDDLILRADDLALQELVGKPAVRLLGAVDPSLLAPPSLREVLLGLRSREELLGDAEARGALVDLLRREEAVRLAELLGTDAGDPFESLRALRVRRGSERERMLFAFFGLRPTTPEPVPEAPEFVEQAGAYGLFPHQRRASRRVQELLVRPPHRVVLHMPTGAGKTRTAMHVIADHLRAHEPGLVVWLASSEELCEQAAQEFEAAWGHLGDRAVGVHRYWGGRDLEIESVDDGFLVAGLAKLYQRVRARAHDIGRLGARATLVVFDEAHQAIAPTYRLLVEALTTHDPAPGLLGLTATPGRTWDDVEADAELANFFGRRKVMLEVPGYDSPVDYLVEEGYLARVRYESLLVEPGIELSAADRAQIADGFDIPQALLVKLAEDEERNLAILERIGRLVQDHRRILVFAATARHAELLATVLRARGTGAFSVTAETDPRERTRRIAAFKAEGEEPLVLCNYGVLTTGFDAPQTTCALVARPTDSLVLYSQMVGRAIRGPRAGGTAEALIVTVIDQNLPGFRSAAEAFTNWEDVWS